MIRRISKSNDLKDLIKSCPTGVIDDIYSIKYYIQGFNVEVEAQFTKVGNILEVILPTSMLELLPNGILMRRAYYKVEDSSYPDGYYNLVFEDNMDIWLGENETEEPIIPDYVTEEELSSTLSSYATESWVSSQNFATESWVEAKSYITSQALDGYATESWVSSQSFATENWVESQGFLDNQSTFVYDENLTSYLNNWLPSQYSPVYAVNTSSVGLFFGQSSYLGFRGLLITPSGKNVLVSNTLLDDVAGTGDIDKWSISNHIATESWVSSQNFATESWVEAKSYITSQALDGYATESWVSSQSFATENWVEAKSYITSQALDGYATESWVSSQEFATQSWVQSQGYLTSVPSEFATESWVMSQGEYLASQILGVVAFSLADYVKNNTMITYISNQNFASKTWVSSQQFATQSWVSSNFLSSTALTGYATETWVQNQGYLTSHQDLSSYATQSWVQSQGYLTSETIPSDIATQSWVSSNFLSSTALTGYATESWVQNQGYLTSHQDLSSYATKSWATSQFFEESKIWVGTFDQWLSLTSTQQAGYTIALIKE